MRIFVAIEFDEVTKDYLEDVQNKVKENSKKGNFTQKENFHITLRYLGEMSPSDKGTLIQAVNEAAIRNRAFDIKLNKLGAFVQGTTSIVWVGLDKSAPLNRLYMSLEKALEKQGFRRDKKPYSPHITLGREVAVSGNPNNVLKQIDMGEKEYTVSSVTLMESKRLGNKLVYYPLYTTNLK